MDDFFACVYKLLAIQRRRSVGKVLTVGAKIWMTSLPVSTSF